MKERNIVTLSLLYDDKDIYKKEDGGKAEYEYMMQW